MKNRALADAVVSPERAAETTEGQQNYTPALVCSPFAQNASWCSDSINPADIWVTSKDPGADALCVCGRVTTWTEQTLVFAINRKNRQQSCVSIQLWDVSRC